MIALSQHPPPTSDLALGTSSNLPSTPAARPLIDWRFVMTTPPVTTGFTNPVIPGLNPDPSVCRVGDDYYLVTSSFIYFPGVPIYHSTNLVDWKQIGNVLDRSSQLDLSGTHRWSSGGIFAPTIRFHDGLFYMITTLYGDAGLPTFFVTATDPAGPWSDPIVISGLIGIDPDLAWDDEGNCWVHFSMGGIQRCRIDVATGAMIEQPEPTWSGTGLHAPEAPHLFRRGDCGTSSSLRAAPSEVMRVSIARGTSPRGPWEGCPTNPILSHRSRDHPIQNTGHADFVETADGNWWMVLLAARPSGTTPRFHILGRETFLTSVEWIDGWPVPAPLDIEMPSRPSGPSATVELALHEDFDDPSLASRWVSVRRPANTFASLTDRPGWLTLDGTDASLDGPDPAYVSVRQQHQRCTTRIRVSQTSAVASPAAAGLVVYMDSEAHYSVAVSGELVVASARIGPLLSTVGEASRPPGDVVLRIDSVDHDFGPDGVRLGIEHSNGDGDGKFEVLAELDGRYLSTEVTGGFIGRTIGPFASGCVAQFDWFTYGSLEVRASRKGDIEAAIG